MKNAALLFVGQALIVLPVERPHPELHDVVSIGPEIGEIFSVGRNLRIATLGIAEEYFARDEARLIRSRGAGGKKNEGDQERGAQVLHDVLLSRSRRLKATFEL
jgi:hypothetical protein